MVPWTVICASRIPFFFYHQARAYDVLTRSTAQQLLQSPRAVRMYAKPQGKAKLQAHESRCASHLR